MRLVVKKGSSRTASNAAPAAGAVVAVVAVPGAGAPSGCTGATPCDDCRAHAAATMASAARESECLTSRPAAGVETTSERGKLAGGCDGVMGGACPATTPVMHGTVVHGLPRYFSTANPCRGRRSRASRSVIELAATADRDRR